MNSAPDVSVIVSLFNKAPYIAETLRSALTQSFSNFEIVVVDDGSTDGSADRVRLLDDRRIRLFVQANTGVAGARNRAMAEARAHLVAFLDADDLWRPDHLRHLLALKRRFPEALLCGNSFRAFASEANAGAAQPSTISYALLDDYFAECAKGAQPFFTSSCMADRAAALRIGFPAGHSRGEDLSVWLKLAAAAPVATSNYVGCDYRRSPYALTAEPPRTPDISMTTLTELISTHAEWPSSRKNAARELYNRLALAHALDCLFAGDPDSARQFLSLASGTKLLRARWLAVRFLVGLPPFLRELTPLLRRGSAKQMLRHQ